MSSDLNQELNNYYYYSGYCNGYSQGYQTGSQSKNYKYYSKYLHNNDQSGDNKNNNSNIVIPQNISENQDPSSLLGNQIMTDITILLQCMDKSFKQGVFTMQESVALTPVLVRLNNLISVLSKSFPEKKD